MNKKNAVYKNKRTTVALKTSTKEKIDHARAPGQCYDGFISQMVDFWNSAHLKNKHIKA